MFVVGLTGGIGSGKTAASDRFAEHGIIVVDGDVIARQVVEPGSDALRKIVAKFGPGILHPNGELDRASLREWVFSQPEDRHWLEQVLHPLIGEEVIAQLNAANSPYVLLVSPLLVDTGQTALCDRVLVVDVPESVQIERTCLRDDNAEDMVKHIIAAQTSRENRLAAATDVIDNTGSLEDLQRQVDTLHERYLELARAKPRTPSTPAPGH